MTESGNPEYLVPSGESELQAVLDGLDLLRAALGDFALKLGQFNDGGVQTVGSGGDGLAIARAAAFVELKKLEQLLAIPHSSLQLTRVKPMLVQIEFPSFERMIGPWLHTLDPAQNADYLAAHLADFAQMEARLALIDAAVEQP